MSDLVKRLRARAIWCIGEHGYFSAELHEESAAEIERLRVDRDAWEKTARELDARVEELERPYERTPDDPVGTERYITDDQINAAVRFAEGEYQQLKSAPNAPWVALNKLNIYCHENGDGWVMEAKNE